MLFYFKHFLRFVLYFQLKHFFFIHSKSATTLINNWKWRAQPDPMNGNFLAPIVYRVHYIGQNSSSVHHISAWYWIFSLEYLVDFFQVRSMWAMHPMWSDVISSVRTILWKIRIEKKWEIHQSYPNFFKSKFKVHQNTKHARRPHFEPISIMSVSQILNPSSL